MDLAALRESANGAIDSTTMMSVQTNSATDHSESMKGDQVESTTDASTTRDLIADFGNFYFLNLFYFQF